MAGKYYVYFLKSVINNKVYVGYTSKDPKIRLIEHNGAKNKWTGDNRPFVLVYYEDYCCKTDAIRREKFYKSRLGLKIKKAILSTVETG